MKKVHKNRNRRFNQRLMESWGYSRNRTGGYKRDDERPLEAGLAEEEVAPDAAEKSKKQEIEGLAAEAIAAIHKLGSAAGATIDATVDTGGPAQMSDIAEMIEQEIRKMLLKEEDDPVVVDIDKDGDMDLMISADFEQGSFETSGPSTDWALTPAQIGAMQETGKMEDDLARGIDLKGVLMNATQGSHPDFLDVLELSAFQKDPRVKEHGY